MWAPSPYTLNVAHVVSRVLVRYKMSCAGRASLGFRVCSPPDRVLLSRFIILVAMKTTVSAIFLSAVVVSAAPGLVLDVIGECIRPRLVSEIKSYSRSLLGRRYQRSDRQGYSEEHR